MWVITLTGNFEFYMLIIPFLYWCVNPQLGLWAMFAAGLSDVTTTYFKQAIHLPRPYWAYESVDLLSPIGSSSFSTPSGHASGTLTFWGYIALFYKKTWLWAAVLTLVLLVGISRVYLGVHFPSDIALGWGLAIIILFLVLVGQRVLPPTLGLRKPGRAIFYAFLFSAVIITVGAVVVILSKAPIWLDHAHHAFSMNGYVTDGGVLFGALAGYVLMRRDLRYSATGSVFKKILRYVIGAAVLAGIWLGLDIVFEPLAPENSPIGFALRFVRYALVGFWVSYLAPLVFVWTGLASRQKRQKA